MVAQQVVHRPRIAPAHRHALTAGVVVLDHRAGAAGPLEMGADVVRRHAVQHGFDAVAVAVVDKAGAGRVAYGRQAVFGVVGKGEVLPPNIRVVWVPLATANS